MIPVLVDSNVILDVVTRDPVWAPWSARVLRGLADEAVLVVNAVIYGEVSVAYTTIEAVDAMLDPQGLRREAIPFQAAFLAGKAFVEYRRRGGHRQSPLPDFYIGAHAAVAGYRLLTRDPARYRTYFPKLELITP